MRCRELPRSMSDYKPGDPIADFRSVKRVPQLRAFYDTERNLRAFFCRPKDFLTFGFFLESVKTPGRVAEKRIALIQKEATKQWQQQKAKKSVSD